MTDLILENINKHVKYGDILINLGDFVFKNHKDIPKMRARIVCETVHHVVGNHDNKINLYENQFSSISDIMKLEYYGHKFVLCHYAMRVWNQMHKGAFHLYGHSHDTLDKPPLPVWGRSMDIGIDSAYRLLGEYRPFHIQEIIEILSKRKSIKE